MASYTEIASYLASVPGASPTWAEGFYSAGLTLENARTLVATMAADRTSPLREAEEGVLSKEIVRMSASMGSATDGVGNGRLRVKSHHVLSMAERTRVTRLTGHFCQPVFVARAKFARSSHTTMTAVRRMIGGYQYSRATRGARVLEVGPDVGHFIMTEDTDGMVGSECADYVGSRVAIGVRDVIRMQWGALLDRILEKKIEVRQAVFDKAQAVKAGIMRNKRVEDMNEPVDGIISTDSNYDLEFHMMPGVMARTHAKWWYGTMCRAKGLTRRSRMQEGRLELCGTTWRVDWQRDRIDFRHPNCAAFGYSHKVSSYMQYEEYNGYVWHGSDAHYVYSKGPETNDELLFFSVHKVHYPMALKEPTFVEHPHANKVRLESVWAVGGEISGVPTSFEAVIYYVDPLNFAKVLEKRRELDYKGDISATLNIIRSTNVFFFLNGTPVSASTKIEARLAEATAVVVEVLCAENRLSTNMAFGQAMEQFEYDVKKSSWVMRMLESIVDIRAAVGALVAPVCDLWEGLRAPMADAATRDIRRLRVSACTEELHIKLSDGHEGGTVCGSYEYRPEVCFCSHLVGMRLDYKRKKLQRVADHVLVAMEMAIRELERVECCCKKRILSDVEESAKIVSEASSAVGGSQTSDAGDEGETVSQTESSDWASEVNAYDDGYADGADVGSGETAARKETSSCVEEVIEHGGWQGSVYGTSVETRAVEEFLQISRLQVEAVLTEVRIDAQRIWDRGISEVTLSEFQTSRTKHACLEVHAGRVVKRIGAYKEVTSALYDPVTDMVWPLVERPYGLVAKVKDGWYYTNNHLKVWNHAEVSSAVQHALDVGVPRPLRALYGVTLGVPGAGKTYAAMKMLAPYLRERPEDVMYLGVTKAAVKAAVKEAVVRGVQKKVAQGRCMTVDRYLMHVKAKVKILVIDEAPAEHMGKVDAVVIISGATVVKLYGDACQVEYSPFVQGYVPECAAPGKSVPEENYDFMAESHRCNEDVCAAWLHKYPRFYPCECHRVGDKAGVSMVLKRVKNVAEIPFDKDARYHTYRQDEKEEVRQTLPFVGDMEVLRATNVGGLATVHEDQGSTHRKVVSVRPFPDYERHQSEHNPTLHNRDCYVLSDTTRHTESYVRYTACPERDGVARAIERSARPDLLLAVREKRGIVDIPLSSLWA
jgi:hypothetical protein